MEANFIQYKNQQNNRRIELFFPTLFYSILSISNYNSSRNQLKNSKKN